jgi:hypothetical protein
MTEVILCCDGTASFSEHIVEAIRNLRSNLFDKQSEPVVAQVICRNWIRKMQYHRIWFRCRGDMKK